MIVVASPADASQQKLLEKILDATGIGATERQLFSSLPEGVQADLTIAFGDDLPGPFYTMTDKKIHSKSLTTLSGSNEEKGKLWLALKAALGL